MIDAMRTTKSTENGLEQAEKILALMRDFERICCPWCTGSVDRPGCADIECEIRFASQARRMVEGGSEYQS